MNPTRDIGWWQIGTSEVPVAVVEHGRPYFHGETAKANACLIAAAPELLDALQDALAELSPLMQAYRPEHADAIVGKARAAIAKAEGR